jgi:hypothetical protein
MRFLELGGRARVLRKPATIAGRRWPAGTWFVPVRGNDSVQARATRAGLGGYAVAVSTGHSDEGIDLGSENVVNVRRPRVAVVSGEGVDPTSFGALWFFLDQQVGMGFDAVEAGDLGRVDLGKYDVVVVPDAASRVVKNAEEALKGFVQRGGRLVALAGGAEAVAAMAEVKVREPQKDSANARRFLAGREEREKQEWRQEVPGTIVAVTLDPAHPLAFGAGLDANPGQTFVLHMGSTGVRAGGGDRDGGLLPPGAAAARGGHLAREPEAAGAGRVAGEQADGPGHRGALRRRPALPPLLALQPAAADERDPAGALSVLAV